MSAEAPVTALTHRGDRGFKAALSSCLFLYMGFIVAVILASAVWLGRVNGETGTSYIASLAANGELRGEILFALKLSAVTSVITACLGMLIGIPSAYVLSRYRLRWLGLVDTIIDLPIVMPPLIAGIALLLFFRQSPLGQFIEAHLVPVVYTRTGIVVAQFFIASAFAIRAIKATFDQISPRFEAVARSLGCSPWRAFWVVALPLARNGIVAGAVMTWARAMGEFAPIMMLAGASPRKTAVLSVTAFLNMSSGHIEASIAIVVLMVIIAAVTLTAFKRFGGQGYIW